MDIGDDLILRKKEDVIERSGEELLIFDSSVGKLLEVNETGKVIWSMLDGEHSVKEIKERIEDQFEDIHELDIDIRNFLTKLLELDLIEKVK